MATKYIVHTTDSTKEFMYRWNAIEYWSKYKHLGAWIEEIEPQRPQYSQQIQEHTAHTIDKYCDRLFSRGFGKLF